MNERRNALITGASAGLGVSFARQLASKGYDLVLVARRGDQLRTVGKEIARDSGCSYHVIEADLMDVEAPNPSTLQRRRKDLKSITWSTMQALRDLICCRTGIGVIRPVFTN